MANENTIQQFKTTWNKTASWARKQGIKDSSIYPVYQMDSKRIMSGEAPMSESERYRAILASAGINHPTDIPSDNPSPTHVFSNAVHDLWGVFTGLAPNRLIPELGHEISSAIHHPQEMVVKPIESMLKGNFAPAALPTKYGAPLTVFIPGVAVAGELQAGQQSGYGARYVLDHPVSSFLDLIPDARVPTSILAKTSKGADIAEKLGMSPDEMAKTSPIRLTSRAVRNIRTNKMGLAKDLHGNTVYKPLTVGERITSYKTTHHVGKNVSDIAFGKASLENKATNHFQRVLGPFVDAVSTLDDNQRLQTLTMLETGKYGTIPEIISNDRIPLSIRRAVEAYQPVQQEMQQLALQSGRLSWQKMPEGDVQLYVTQSANRIVTARTKYETLSERFDKVADKADAIQQVAAELDRQAAPIVGKLLESRSSVWDSITSTIPRVKNEDVAQHLRDTLAGPRKFERAPTFRRSSLERLHVASPSTRRGLNFPPPSVLSRLGLSDNDIAATLLQHGELTKTQARVISEIFSPTGHIERIQRAFDAHDWTTLREESKKLDRKLSNQASREIQIPNSPLFDTIRSDAKQLYEYAKFRVTKDKEFNEAFFGKTQKGQKVSAYNLAVALGKAHDAFVREAVRHPPDVYRPLFNQILQRKILEHEQSEQILKSAEQHLASRGATKAQLHELRSDPKVLMQLVDTFAGDTYDDPIVGDNYRDVVASVRESAFKELSRLRAAGIQPEYVPSVSTHDLRDELLGSYNVTLDTRRIPKASYVFSRMFGPGSSINNLVAAGSTRFREALRESAANDFHENYIKPQAYKQSDLLKIIENEPYLRNKLLDTTNPADRRQVVESILRRDLNLVRYDPHSIFPFAAPRTGLGEEPLYLEHGLSETLEKMMNPADGAFARDGIVDKATGVFRTAILRLSPRFTAHILFGGSFLVALRNPLAFRYIGRAYQMLKDGRIPEDVLPHPTQYGYNEVAFNYMGGRTAAKWLMEEKLARYNIPHQAATISDWVRAAADLNFRFTRYVTNMQRSIVYLDGAEKVAKGGKFLDEDGNPLDNMTAERAHHTGMLAAEKVMGDVRRMTPLEQSIARTFVPFYGWTKHILSYVLTYPMDHPYRAMFLSQLADLDTNSVASGLPMRIQLLLFLGHPDEYGNVSALDVAPLNPLRDVANYASWGGLISAINPIFTAPFAAVDPSITFGENTLYPKTTYSDIYGISTVHSSQNGLMTALQQIIPQTGALQAAFQMGGYYRDLKKNNPEAFDKVIANAFNVPFFNIQHINIREMAAKGEIDRYAQAEDAARSAIETGDFSTVDQYPSTVPLPLNPEYAVSPEMLHALYNQSMQQTGLPPTETMAAPPAPPGL